jgi:hypothetical protein
LKHDTPSADSAEVVFFWYRGPERSSTHWLRKLLLFIGLREKVSGAFTQVRELQAQITGIGCVAQAELKANDSRANQLFKLSVKVLHPFS